MGIPRITDNNIKCVKYNKTILTLFKKTKLLLITEYGHGSTILCALLVITVVDYKIRHKLKFYTSTLVYGGMSG